MGQTATAEPAHAQGFAAGGPQGGPPPGFGGSLFRTVGADNLDGAPITPGAGGSPFAPYASPERTTLTAGDFLPHLPADVARANGVMPDQPVAISPQALEAAISSGQLAVPLFEIYHVCPALFRVPVSPHDTRMVPLPKSKLPSMIASHTSALKPPSGPAGMNPGSGAQASPFGMSQGGAPASPFGANPSAPASPFGANPGAQASPFGTAPAASGSPFGMAAPAAPTAQGAPNPFAPTLPELPPSGPMAGAQPGVTRPAGTLPPRRPPGTAPAIPTQADFIGQNPLTLPGQPSMDAGQGQGPKPFMPMGMEPPSGGMGPGPAPMASPFGALPGQPQAAMPPAQGATSLLFGMGKPSSDPELGGSGSGPLGQGAPPASPFGAMPGGSPFAEQPPPAGMPSASPFGAMPGAPAAPMPGGSPFGESATPAAPFGSPLGGMASPFGSPPAAMPPESPFAAGGPPPAPPSQGGSPFQMEPGASPFAGGPSAGASPFAGGMPGQAAGASPFASPAPAAGAFPFGAPTPGVSPLAGGAPTPAAAGGASPFASLPGGSPGSPFASGMPASGAGPVSFPPAAPAAESASPFQSSSMPPAMGQPLPFTPFAPPAAAEPVPPAAPFSPPVQSFGGAEPGLGQLPPVSMVPPVASFEVPQRHVTPEPPKLGSLPFSGQPQRPMIKVQPPPHMMQGQGGAPMTPPAGSEEMMEISLAAVLKGQTAQDLGFDPNFIPGWITTKLPALEVREQLGTGQVALALGTIIDGTDHSFRSVISHGRRDHVVCVPAAEVFHTMAPASNLPSLTPPPAAAPSNGLNPPVMGAAPTPLQPLPFQPPQASNPATGPLTFQPMVVPAFPAGPDVGSAPASPFQMPVAAATPPAAAVPEPAKGAFDPFAAAAGDWGGKAGSPLFAPAPEPVKPEGFSSEQLFAEKPVPPAFAPAAAPVPAPAPLFAPAPEKAPISFFADPAPAPVRPAPLPLSRDEGRTPSVPMVRAAMETVFQPAPMAAPVTPAAPAPVAPARQAAAAPMTGLSLTAAGDDEQLMLRALLGVSDKLTRQTVLEHAAKLPGVAACAWIAGGKVMVQGDGSKAAQNFQQQAGDIAVSLRTLARLTGLEAETLSITLGDRMLTFCLQQEKSLGVLHTGMEPPSGLREKVTLLSRELAQMHGD